MTKGEVDAANVSVISKLMLKNEWAPGFSYNTIWENASENLRKKLLDYMTVGGRRDLKCALENKSYEKNANVKGLLESYFREVKTLISVAMGILNKPPGSLSNS